MERENTEENLAVESIQGTKQVKVKDLGTNSAACRGVSPKGGEKRKKTRARLTHTKVIFIESYLPGFLKKS